MPHFLAPDNTMHFLDDIAFVHRLPEGSVQLSEAEAQSRLAALNPVTAATLLGALAAEYEARMQVIAAAYPPSERESWPVQMQEAQALLADSQATTPWIDAAAQARGLTRHELATRIAAKNDAYRLVSGTLTGIRQAIEDQITAAGTDAQALAAIDVKAGWPN